MQLHGRLGIELGERDLRALPYPYSRHCSILFITYCVHAKHFDPLLYIHIHIYMLHLFYNFTRSVHGLRSNEHSS